MKKQAVLVVAIILMVAVPASAQQVRVNHNRTPLRAEPTSTSTPLAFYSAGAALDIVSLNDGWYKLRDPKTKQEGYMLASLVDVLSESAYRTPPAAAVRPAGGAPTAAAQEAPRKPGEGQPLPPPRPDAPNARSATGRPASAPPASPAKGWTDHAFIGVGAVYQPGSSAFSESYSYTEYVEPAAVTTEYPAMKGPAFDAGGAFRIWRSVGVGVNVTGASRSGDATVSASIPHPFYFGVERAIEGSVPVKRSEYAVHVHGLWVIPVGQRLLVAVGGGPSLFSVKQSLVESITYSQDYPYDSATFASASVTDASATAVGYGTTLDVAYYFSRTIGIGGVVRYSKGTVSWPSHGSTITADAGGVEAGVGIRVRFRQGTPKPRQAPQPAPTNPSGR